MTYEEQVLEFIKQTIKNTEWENKVFLVGGAVRDQVMGKPPKDLDFIVDGDISSGIDFSIWLSKKWNIFKDGSNPVIFPDYGTAKLLYDNIDIEFVAPRKEKYKSGSKKPEVTSGVLMDDVLRRDLTINTLMRNVSTNEILDLTEMEFLT
jgi:poly(A) polymerase